MRVIFAGTPRVAIPTLEAIQASGHVLAGILTREDAAQGRRQVITPSEVATWGTQHGVPLIRSNRPDESVDQNIAALGADVGIVVAYGALLSRATLNVLPHGWLNLHFSRLPQWRGAAPIQRSILSGEVTTATTIFRLDEGMDTGEVCSVDEQSIGETETASEALSRFALSGARQVVQVLDDLSNDRLTFSAQRGSPTLAPKLRGAEGQLLAEMSADEAFRRYRAVTDEPGAFVETERGRLKILRASASRYVSLRPGVISSAEGKATLGFVNGSLTLEMVQPAGKKPMSGPEWLRGIPSGQVHLVT